MLSSVSDESARPAKKQERPGHAMHDTGRRRDVPPGITRLPRCPILYPLVTRVDLTAVVMVDRHARRFAVTGLTCVPRAASAGGPRTAGRPRTFGSLLAYAQGETVTWRRPVTTPTWGEPGGALTTEEFRGATEAIMANIEQVIEGKSATVRLALAVLLAEGHLRHIVAKG